MTFNSNEKSGISQKAISKMFLFFFFLTDEHISDQGLKGLRNEATEDLLYAGVFCYSIVTIFQGTNLYGSRWRDEVPSGA